MLVLAGVFSTQTLVAQCGLNITAEVNHISCFGQQDGSIELMADVPTVDLSISWVGMPVAVDSELLEGLGPGEYSAAVTNLDGCTEIVSYEMVEPAELVLFGSNQNVCTGSSVTLLDSVVGGTAPFDLQWNTNAGFNCLNCSNTVTATQSDFYNINVTDANGCSASQGIGINVASEITATIEVFPDTCGGTGSIAIIAEGGSGQYTFIVNGDVLATNMIGGLNGGQTVDVFIHDTTGCFYSETIIMPAAIIDIGAEFDVSAVSCPGEENGSIQILAEETLVVGYGIDDPNNLDGTSFFEGLNGGQYSIFIEDVNGCITEHEINVEEALAPVIASNVVDCDCFGSDNGEILLNANGGTFGISDFEIIETAEVASTGIFTGLPAATYTVIATDDNGCEFEQTLTVNQPDEILDTAIIVDCNCWDSEDGEIQMDVTGGAGAFEYSLDNVNYDPAQDFVGLAQGEYNVFIQDSTGCMKSRQVTVSAPDTLELDPEITNATCPGEASGKIVIIASGGTAIYEYKLGNGTFGPSNTFLDLEAGTYQITVKDANGCERFEYVEVEESETPEAEIDKTDATCPNSQNGGIVIVVSGGTADFTYSLDDIDYQSSNVFANLSPAVYTVYLKNDSNCVFTFETEIESGPGIDLDIETAAWAEAAYIDLTVYGGSPPFSYQWDTGDTIQDILVSENGMYVVQVSDAGGCLNSDTANVTRVSVRDLLSEPGYSVYPNPSSDFVEVNITGTNLQVIGIKLIDNRGRTVKKMGWAPASNKAMIDIQSLSIGSYQMVLECADGLKQSRLIKR